MPKFVHESSGVEVEEGEVLTEAKSTALGPSGMLQLLTHRQDEFRAKYSARLDAEVKEREDLELRLQRVGLGGGSLKRVEAGPELKALSGFVRNGEADWSQNAEVKALSVGSDPDGGYIVLPQISAGMTTRLWDISPMRRLARTETVTKGDAWEEPDDRDEAAATWVGEKSARPETAGPKLGMIRIELHEIYANPTATQRLLDDADRDVGAWLEGKISDKFGRSEGSAFVTGDGIGKPRGFLDYTAVAQKDTARAAGKLQYLPTGAASAFASTNPGDALKDLVWSLRTPYRNGAVWMMNSATAAIVDKFKDGQGNYLWRDAVTVGAPNTLLGYPVEIDEGMPDVAANAFPVAFGNFKAGYCIVDRPGIKLLRDPYTNKPNVNFYAYKRVGGGVTNDDAIKLLKVATS